MLSLRSIIPIVFYFTLPGVAISADVLLFSQDCNVDAAGADNTCADERYNILNILYAQGHIVTALPDFHQVNLASLLNSHDFFLIPDLEDISTCDVFNNTFINLGEKMILKDYVENGGRILVTGSAKNIDFINEVFGLTLSITTFTNSGNSIKNDLETNGTPFESCSATIPNLTATFLVTASMPSTKKCLYSSGGDASIAFFNVGQGSVTYLGFDYNDAGPKCSQNTSLWVECAFSSGVEVATFGINGKPAEIPTLSQWGIIILFLSLGIVGLVAMQPSSTFANS